MENAVCTSFWEKGPELSQNLKGACDPREDKIGCLTIE
jgi:hypothetical protein